MFLVLQNILSYADAVDDEESTRSIPENMSRIWECHGFEVSGFLCVLDESRADSASLIHPSIDRETRSTLSSSSELTTLGRLIDLR